MKPYFFYFFFALISNSASAQNYKYQYYLDQNLVSIDKNNATFLGKGVQEDSIFLVDVFDINTGKRTISAHFKDSSLTYFEGNYSSYFSTGQVRQKGNYRKGKQEGEWTQWDSTGLQLLIAVFDKGTQISFTKFDYEKGKLIGKSINDGNGNEVKYVMYDKKGNEINDEKVFVKADEKPIFRSGKIPFQDYILQQIDRNLPASKGAPNGRYLVSVNFIVEKDGRVTNVKYESVTGYGMDAEAMRVVADSPLWQPAMLNGRPVRFQMREFVPFIVNR